MGLSEIVLITMISFLVFLIIISIVTSKPIPSEDEIKTEIGSELDQLKPTTGWSPISISTDPRARCLLYTFSSLNPTLQTPILNSMDPGDQITSDSCRHIDELASRKTARVCLSNNGCMNDIGTIVPVNTKEERYEECSLKRCFDELVLITLEFNAKDRTKIRCISVAEENGVYGKQIILQQCDRTNPAQQFYTYRRSDDGKDSVDGSYLKLVPRVNQNQVLHPEGAVPAKNNTIIVDSPSTNQGYNWYIAPIGPSPNPDPSINNDRSPQQLIYVTDYNVPTTKDDLLPYFRTSLSIQELSTNVILNSFVEHSLIKDGNTLVSNPYMVQLIDPSLITIMSQSKFQFPL